MTFGIELHGWRTGYSSDLFYVWVRLGFISFTFSKELVSEALKRINERLGKVSAASKLGGSVLIQHEGTVE